MCAPGDRIGVAVSGGSDSLALLLALHELAPELGLQLSVLHLDHRLRPDSGEDAAFVGEWAARLGLTFTLRRADALPSARGNREQAARRARLEFFRAYLEAGEADGVATAHTADDQAETVLFRLLRGGGTRGLAAIWPVARLGPGRLLRPAIDCRRGQLRQWLTAKGVRWREDASNLDLSLRRNRIRHCLLPQLEREYNPNVVGVLARLATLAREEEEYWRQQIEALAARFWRPCAGGVEGSTAELAALPAALARRLLRAGLERVKGDLRRLDFPRIDAALEQARAAASGPAKSVSLPGLTLVVGPKLTIIRRGDGRL